MSNTAAERVAKGITLLDGLTCCSPACSTTDGRLGVVDRKWRDKIKASTLDLASSYECVLGQLFGEYEDGLRKVGLSTGMEYGFCDGYGDDGGNYVRASDLTEEWLRQLGLATINIVGGKFYRRKTYATGNIFKAHHSFTQEGVTFWVMESAYIEDDKFVSYEPKAYRVRTLSLLESDYEEWIEPLKFEAGDLLGDEKGGYYFVQNSSKIWKLDSTGGSTHCTLSYWQEKNGTLKKLQTNIGKDLAQEIANG